MVSSVGSSVMMSESSRFLTDSSHVEGCPVSEHTAEHACIGVNLSVHNLCMIPHGFLFDSSATNLRLFARRTARTYERFIAK